MPRVLRQLMEQAGTRIGPTRRVYCEERQHNRGRIMNSFRTLGKETWPPDGSKTQHQQPGAAVALYMSIRHVNKAHELSVDCVAAGLRGGPTPPSLSQSTLWLRSAPSSNTLPTAPTRVSTGLNDDGVMPPGNQLFFAKLGRFCSLSQAAVSCILCPSMPPKSA